METDDHAEYLKAQEISMELNNSHNNPLLLKDWFYATYLGELTDGIYVFTLSRGLFWLIRIFDEPEDLEEFMGWLKEKFAWLLHAKNYNAASEHNAKINA